MNLPRTTDQARKELHTAVDKASPIQILMFLVIFQAVQIVDYLQKVQLQLPAPRKSLPPPDKTIGDIVPMRAEEHTLNVTVNEDADAETLGERFAEEFWRLHRESMNRPWTISHGSRMLSGAFDRYNAPPPPASINYEDLSVTWTEESQEISPGLFGYWDTGHTDDESVYHRKMANAQQRRHNIIDNIIPERGPDLPTEVLTKLIEDAHDRERQIRFEHMFPGYGFDSEKYQYAMDYDGASYFPHPFIEDREAALRFKYEARRFEIQNGQGRYLIAGMPSHRYREMQRQDRQHFGMVGYCTPDRGGLFTG